MTSLQAAHRCARHLQEPDLARMPLSMLMEVLDALNAALQIAYTYLPREQRCTTVSELLAAPVNVSVTIAGAQSNYTTGTPFTVAQRGCTVRLCDDAHDNEIVATNAFLDAFLGNSLTGQATIYSDCIPIFAVIREVTSEVRVYDNGHCVAELHRDQSIRGRRGHRQIGLPRHYALEPVGGSQNAEPEYYLRVYPMPSRALRVRFEAAMATIRVTLPQLTGDAIVLPVPDDLCESVLIPLAEAQLLKSRFWANPNGTRTVEQQSQNAMELIARQPRDITLNNARCMTPAGF